MKYRNYFRGYLKTFGKSIDELIVKSKTDYRLLNVLVAYTISDQYTFKYIKAKGSPEAQQIINCAISFLNEDIYDFSYWTKAIMRNIKRKAKKPILIPSVGPEYCKLDIEKLIHGYISKRYLKSVCKREIY